MVTCECGKFFATEQGHRSHLTRLRCQGPPQADDNVYPLCRREFKSYPGMRQHYRKTHTEEHNREMEDRYEQPEVEEREELDLIRMVQLEIACPNLYKNKFIQASFPGVTIEQIRNRRKKQLYIDYVNHHLDCLKQKKQNEESDKKVKENQETDNPNCISALSVEDALAQLPPIDKSILIEDDQAPCTCILKENKSDFSVEEDAEIDIENKFVFIEDHDCQSKLKLREIYHLDHVTDEMVERLHDTHIPNVNGNFSMGPLAPEAAMQENGLYVNVVPNVNIESIPKNVKDFAGENFSRYSFSETQDVKEDIDKRTGGDVTVSDNKCFREWHEVIDTTSYQGEILKILPYVIID